MEELLRNWTVSLTRSGLIGFEPRTRPERFPGIKRRGSPLQKGLQVKANPVKEKLRNGEATVGTWLSLGDLSATRTLARAGFDWLTVDMEHWPIDWGKAASLFGAISDAGCVPLARVPSGSHDNIKRALDSGAWGVVVPMVDTVEEAQEAIAACKYPPVGNRSLGGGLHALNFDAPVVEYYSRANDEVLVVLMTESSSGIRNAEAIYALPGVDAVFVGPTDLRANMNSIDGEVVSDEEVEAAIQEVIGIGKRVGTPTGMHTFDPTQALDRISEGMQFIAISSDIHLMTTHASEVLLAITGDTGGASVTY